VAAGAAGGVQRGPARQAIEDVPDQWLLQVDQAVSRLVVGHGPGAVALPGRDRGRVGSFAELVRRSQQGPDLGEARLGEGTVILSGERAEQGGTLHAEQIGQRMLIDHRQIVGAPGETSAWFSG
jgi:hypothetical protein